MSVTVTSICNMALSHIEQTGNSISNLEMDEGKIADILRTYYDTARQFVLTTHMWNFATKSQALALLAELKDFNYLFKYEYPVDCLQFRAIQNLNTENYRIPFSIESNTLSTKCILTNQDKAVGIYTFDADNPRLFSPSFVLALSWYLASLIAPAISSNGSETLRICKLSYMEALAASKAMDSNEGQRIKQPLASWDIARGVSILNG